MKIFFISPVRMVTPESKEACGKYVEELEAAGHQVHWPIRDIDQTDTVGIQICDTNLKRILEANEIHIWYHETSTGIHFDIGAAYLLVRILRHKKKIVFANRSEFTDKIHELNMQNSKHYLRVLDFLDKRT